MAENTVMPSAADLDKVTEEKKIAEGVKTPANLLYEALRAWGYRARPMLTKVEDEAKDFEMVAMAEAMTVFPEVEHEVHCMANKMRTEDREKIDTWIRTCDEALEGFAHVTLEQLCTLISQGKAFLGVK